MTGQVTVTYFVVQNCLDNKSCLYWGWNYWLPCPVPRPLGSPFVTRPQIEMSSDMAICLLT
jgi:hypothetical protein